MALPSWAFDDPKALVDAIYAPYTTLGAATAQDPAQYYSERLRGLVAANAAPQGEEAPPVLAFNPFIGAKQALLRDLSIGTPVGNTERAIVTVSFGNFDEVSLLALSLVREGDGWKVDDIALARRRRELVVELAPSIRSLRHQIARVASFSQALASPLRLGPISRSTRLW